MLTDEELPPLPKADFRLYWSGAEYKVTKPSISEANVFTAEQMKAYARAVEQAAYAAAIKACENEQVDAESSGSHLDVIYNNAVNDCATAIESLMQEQPK